MIAILVVVHDKLDYENMHVIPEIRTPDKFCFLEYMRALEFELPHPKLCYKCRIFYTYIIIQ